MKYLFPCQQIDEVDGNFKYDEFSDDSHGDTSYSYCEEDGVEREDEKNKKTNESEFYKIMLV